MIRLRSSFFRALISLLLVWEMVAFPGTGTWIWAASASAGGAQAIDSNSQAAIKLFKEADELMQGGQANLAVEKLTAILLKDPGNRAARRELTQLLSAEKSKNKTRERPLSPRERKSIVQLAYNRLKRANPEIIERMIIQAANYERQKFYVLACKTYMQVIALNGLSLETKYAMEKRLRAASERTNSKIESLPQNVRTQYRDAFTLMSVGDWEESLDAWQAYARKFPKDDEIQILINSPEAKRVLKERSVLTDAQLAFAAQDYSKAKELYEKALKVTPGNSDAMEGLRLIEEREEKIRKQALVQGSLHKAQALLKSDKEDEAFSLLLATFKEDPSNQDILGLLLTIQKNSKRKRSFVVQQPQIQRDKEPDAPKQPALERSASKAETHYQRGLVYYGMRNFKDSLAEWEVALKYDPSHRKAARALERVKSDLKMDQ